MKRAITTKSTISTPPIANSSVRSVSSCACAVVVGSGVGVSTGAGSGSGPNGLF
jgi:hypothetical protein